MHFSKLAVPFALAFTFVTANPMPADDVSLDPRGEDTILQTLAGQDYTCCEGPKNDGKFISKISQDKSIGYYRKAKTDKGLSGYPKPFENHEKLKFQQGCSKDVWELPVLADNTQYKYWEKKGDTNPPGRMRVYYTKDLKFCGIGAKLNADSSGPPHLCKVGAQCAA